MVHCDSNQRCAACPIERLPDASDRVLAGSVVRSISRKLQYSNERELTLSTVRIITEERASHMYAEELIPQVFGAVALNLSGQCKLEEIG